MDRKQREIVPIQLKNISEKILRCLIFILIGVFTLWASSKAWNPATGSAAKRFFYLILAMTGGFCAGGYFIKIFLPGIVEKISDSLLSPKRYLQKPSPLLSLPENLIRQKKYSEAEENLLSLLEMHPGESSIIFMLLEMYVVKMRDKTKGEELCKHFFAQEKRSYAPENLQILLLCVDMLTEQKRFLEALALILREKKSEFYSEQDKLSMEKRSASLLNIEKNTESFTQ